MSCLRTHSLKKDEIPSPTAISKGPFASGAGQKGFHLLYMGWGLLSSTMKDSLWRGKVRLPWLLTPFSNSHRGS